LAKPVSQRTRALFSWKLLIAIALTLTIAGSFAFATQTGALKPLGGHATPSVANRAADNFKVTLTLDRDSYALGEVAEVNIRIQNSGPGDVTIDNPEQAAVLIVYDKSMNEVGTWMRFYKALPMNPPLGTLVLRTGQSYAWTFEWNLSIRSGGSETELPTGSYNVQAGVLANTSGSSVEGPNYLSNIAQLTIT
jgi:hypothetical protein